MSSINVATDALEMSGQVKQAPAGEDADQTILINLDGENAVPSTALLFRADPGRLLRQSEQTYVAELDARLRAVLAPREATSVEQVLQSPMPPADRIWTNSAEEHVRTWAAWRDDGSPSDALTLNRLLTALPASPLPLDRLTGAMRTILCARDATLADQLLTRTGALAATPINDPKRLQRLVTLDALAFMLDTLRTRIDPTRVAAAARREWQAMQQRQHERWPTFDARAAALWRQAGWTHALPTHHLWERALPQVRRVVTEELNAMVGELARSGDTEAKRAREHADNDTSEISIDWLLVDASGRLFRELLNKADVRLQRHERGRVLGGELAAIDAPAPAPAKRTEKAGKELPHNHDLVCAACGHRGHPFRLCPTASEEEKNEARARVYRGARRPQPAAAHRATPRKN